MFSLGGIFWSYSYACWWWLVWALLLKEDSLPIERGGRVERGCGGLTELPEPKNACFFSSPGFWWLQPFASAGKKEKKTSDQYLSDSRNIIWEVVLTDTNAWKGCAKIRQYTLPTESFHVFTRTFLLRATRRTIAVSFGRVRGLAFSSWQRGRLPKGYVGVCRSVHLHWLSGCPAKLTHPQRQEIWIRKCNARCCDSCYG